MNQRLCGDGWISLWKNEREILYVEMDISAMVVPVTPEGNVLLITEPSPAYDNRILYLPCGSLEAGEAPASAANREMQEEIGLKAAQLTQIGELYPMVKYVRCRQHVFLAQDFEPSRLTGDEGPDWVIEVQPAPLDDFETLIAQGRLQDSTVIAALYMARSYLHTSTQ